MGGAAAGCGLHENTSPMGWSVPGVTVTVNVIRRVSVTAQCTAQSLPIRTNKTNLPSFHLTVNLSSSSEHERDSARATRRVPQRAQQYRDVHFEQQRARAVAAAVEGAVQA